MIENIQISTDKYNKKFFTNIKCSGKNSFKIFQSTGVSEYKLLSTIKSIFEMIERISVFKYRLPNSNGCAAGINSKKTKLRAAHELIERDAFLWHFKNSIPFNFYKADSKYKYFMLNSVDEHVFVTLVIPKKKYSCIIFGTAASNDLESSFLKSIHECDSQEIVHEKSNEKCKQYYEELFQTRTEDIKCKIEKNQIPALELHHIFSHDTNVQKYWNKLINTKKQSYIKRKNINYDEILYKKIGSYFYFISVFHATHEKLEQLEFGMPETWTKELIYHPFC